MIKKLKEIKPGEIFTFGGYEWIKLEQEGLVLTKDIVATREFDEKSNDFLISSFVIHFISLCVLLSIIISPLTSHPSRLHIHWM